MYDFYDVTLNERILIIDVYGDDTETKLIADVRALATH
jgi:hypothetical protein